MAKAKKKIDLVIGETYFTSDGDAWLVKLTGFEGKTNSMACGPAISLEEGDMSFDGDPGAWGEAKTLQKGIRIATPLEKAWMEACIKANELVPKPTVLPIINDYSIF